MFQMLIFIYSINIFYIFFLFFYVDLLMPPKMGYSNRKTKLYTERFLINFWIRTILMSNLAFTSSKTATLCRICSKLTINSPPLILVPELLTLSKFHRLFRCLQCWLWTCKCRMGYGILKQTFWCQVKAFKIMKASDNTPGQRLPYGTTP